MGTASNYLGMGTASGFTGAGTASAYNPAMSSRMVLGALPANTYNPASTATQALSGNRLVMGGGAGGGGGAAAPQSYYTSDGSYAGSGAAGASAARASSDTMAQYDSMIRQLQGQEGRLDKSLNVGLGNIGNSYNQGENRLNQGRAIAKRNYQTQDGQNMNQYSTTRTGIQNNTRSTANALQRLLGMNGSGNSSAAYEQAPYAAGLQGTQNLNAAQTTYGTNQAALKTSMEDSERQYGNNLEDLKNQKFGQENSLRSSIAQTRASLLDRLSEAQTNRSVAGGASYATAQAAQGGTQSRINGLLDSIVGLGNQYANPVMKTGDVTFKAPTLGNFSLGGQRGIQQGAGGQASVNPLFQTLFQQDDEDKLA